MAEIGVRAPLSLRWAERPGWSPVRVAVGAAFALGVVFVAVEAWLGRLAEFSGDAHLRSDFRIALG